MRADAATLAQSGGFRVEYRDALRAEVAALRALGRFEAALDAEQALRAVELEALRTQSLGTLAGLQARLQDRHSEREIAHLHEQRRIEALEQAHAQRLRTAAMAAAVASGQVEAVSNRMPIGWQTGPDAADRNAPSAAGGAQAPAR